jgi:hypothetical protein
MLWIFVVTNLSIVPITVAPRSKAELSSNPTQGMYVCVCVYCAVLCVSSALRRAVHSSKESYRLCKKTDYDTEEEARAQQRAVEPLMNE